VRRFLRRLGAFYEKHAIAIDLGLITMGAAAVKRRFEEVHNRLETIENGGMVPRDDLVTLRDLENKVGPVLLTHRRALVDAGLLEDSPEPSVDVEVATEAPEGATEAAEAPAEAPGAP